MATSDTGRSGPGTQAELDTFESDDPAGPPTDGGHDLGGGGANADDPIDRPSTGRGAGRSDTTYHGAAACVRCRTEHAQATQVVFYHYLLEHLGPGDIPGRR